MKSAIPREVIDPCGSFEKDDRLTCCRWRVAINESCHAGNLEIVEPADKSTFEALGVEMFEHTFSICHCDQPCNGDDTCTPDLLGKSHLRPGQVCVRCK